MRIGTVCAAFVAGLLTAGSAHAEAAPRPIVVELFTSQGCSSCPPADALLGRLAGQPGVIPLAWHVDYWDRLGWRDPFSSALATQRQSAYADVSQNPEVYTPQMVVDGEAAFVGSREGDARRVLKQQAAKPDRVPVTVTRAGETLHVEVGPVGQAADVWLLATQASATTRIGGGENGGRTLTDIAIVRSATKIGTTGGQTLTLSPKLPAGAEDGSAVILVQAPDAGPILGAAALALKPLG